MKCEDCGKETEKWAECFWCHKKVCAPCFLNKKHDHEDEAAQQSVQADVATVPAQDDPIIKAVNGMLDACVQPPRR